MPVTMPCFCPKGSSDTAFRSSGVVDELIAELLPSTSRWGVGGGWRCRGRRVLCICFASFWVVSCLWIRRWRVVVAPSAGGARGGCGRAARWPVRRPGSRRATRRSGGLRRRTSGHSLGSDEDSLALAPTPTLPRQGPRTVLRSSTRFAFVQEAEQAVTPVFDEPKINA